MSQVDEQPAAVLAEVRRYLEDLVLFEKAEFLMPIQALSESSEFRAEISPLGSTAEELTAFRSQICTCTRCALGHIRQRFVFGAGDPRAGIMFIGEAPGADEDRQGEPFVGEAGQLLTRIVEAMGLAREQVYIANVVKCRPPDNRDPKPEEIAQCEPYLKRQIEIVQPKVICALGRVAAQALLKTDESLGRLRGRLHEYAGIPVICTYHPAALLRNPQWKRPTWEDVKWLRREYDGTEL